MNYFVLFTTLLLCILSINCYSDIPGPSNTTRIEFALVFNIQATYPPNAPAINDGYGSSAFFDTNLQNSNGPRITTDFGNDKSAHYHTNVIVSSDFSSFQEYGTVDFGNGDTINISTYGFSGNFGIHNNWNGDFGGASMGINGGTGIYENAIGVAATTYLTPFNPNPFPLNLYGVVYVPNSNLGLNDRVSLPVINKSC
eukprot:TRINITY_DN8134_c0_g1_i1.p1 TRINITY_DN8134_c0_g1~~TRINITY_DN8134_c0_g1_i1.p1  ORF type:complete len:198 (+),score=71.25 TRINITY_DN8134_c0_g1_i1:36-629(+)